MSAPDDVLARADAWTGQALLPTQTAALIRDLAAALRDTERAFEQAFDAHQEVGRLWDQAEARAERAEAALADAREQIEDLKGRGFPRGLIAAEVGYQAIEERDALRRELAEARGLLARWDIATHAWEDGEHVHVAFHGSIEGYLVNKDTRAFLAGRPAPEKP